MTITTLEAVSPDLVRGRGAGGPSSTRTVVAYGFWALVGMHGAHVTSGLLWLVYMVAQVVAKGLLPHVLRRLLCFSLFWHALDIIWVGVLTVVYLMGAH